ncbi:FAD-dependent monooxygenase [Archangium minus]|uniref:Flavin-dependent monooxygenase n=1 Tax=Archangium minus TaxID=83450 RepID=A0ABY9WW09_9BACT|nr:FAD-dependent monooxygenase [Archangium minus]
MKQRNSLRIAIIGGGPAGLTLARILWTRGVTATVFEQEASSDERPQGGTLDLHPESGQVAVKRAGLEAEFRALARYEDQGMRVMDKQGTLLIDNPEGMEEGERPEIDRVVLRRMLLDSLPEGMVRWGHKLRTLEAREDGSHALTFTNGRSECFDLVVGADGAWSKVRPLLSTAVPEYTGVTFVELGLDDVDSRHPEIARMVGNGSLFAMAEGRGLVAQRNGHGHIRVYAMLKVAEGWVEEGGIDFTNAGRVREGLLKLFSDWAPPLLALIRECGDRIVPRQIYALPVGHRWAHRQGLTLLGDAAHLMSPFGGQGANLAMLDASDLALALTEHEDWAAAVREHELVLCQRAEKAARGAAEGIADALAADAARGAFEHVSQRGKSSAEAQSRA